MKLLPKSIIGLIGMILLLVVISAVASCGENDGYLPTDESCLVVGVTGDDAATTSWMGIRPVEFVKFWKWVLVDKEYVDQEVYTVRFNYENDFLYHLADSGDGPVDPPAEEVLVTSEKVERSRGSKFVEGKESHFDRNIGKYGIIGGTVGGSAATAAYNNAKDDDKEENSGIVVNVTGGGSVDIADNSPSSFDPSTTTGQ